MKTTRGNITLDLARRILAEANREAFIDFPHVLARIDHYLDEKTRA